MNESVVELKNATRCYSMGDEQINALHGVDFKLHNSELVALQGPSGSGKSTLLNICGLIDQLDSGELMLNSENIKSLSQSRRTQIRRKSIGFIFQSFNLIPVMSVYENVELPLLLNGVHSRVRRRMVLSSLERVGIEKYIRHLPDQLSGGQRQRVAIARAIVKSPTLVIADEPTASLDSHTATNIIEMIKSLAQETEASFLMATHDQCMAEYCDRTVYLTDGRICK